MNGHVLMGGDRVCRVAFFPRRGRKAGLTALKRVITCLFLCGGVIAAFPPSEAWAGPPTSVTSLSATASSSAAGALSTWTVGFTTSSSGALEGSAGSTITVTLPTGTTLGSFTGGPVTDVTTDQTVGYPMARLYPCSVVSGTTLTCPRSTTDTR